MYLLDLAIKPIKFSILEKLYIGPWMVLDYITAFSTPLNSITMIITIIIINYCTSLMIMHKIIP